MASTYVLQNEESHLLLKFDEGLRPEDAKDFEQELKELGPQLKNAVVACQRVSELDAPWLRALMVLNRMLKDKGFEMRLVAVSESFSKQLAQQGLDRALKVSAGIPEALADMGIKKSFALDVNFINPFLAATLNTLKVQANVDAKAGKPYRKEPAERMLGDISGVIGLVSPAFSGSVVIGFPEQTFLSLMTLMLGETYTTITPEIADGAGELTNIIFGQAKVKLNEMGYSIKTAIPQVVVGKGHSVAGMTQGPIVVVPFESGIGAFHIEICISQ